MGIPWEQNMLNRIKKWLLKDYYHIQNRLLEQNMILTAKLTALQMEMSQKEVRNPLESWSVSPEAVFSVTKTGLIMLNGEQITTQELKNLKSEVRALKEFQIYRILQHTLRQKAIEKAVLTSTDLYSLKGNEQVLAGKMMVYSLDILKTIIESVDKAKLK